MLSLVLGQYVENCFCIKDMSRWAPAKPFAEKEAPGHRGLSSFENAEESGTCRLAETEAGLYRQVIWIKRAAGSRQPVLKGFREDKTAKRMQN